VEERLVDSLMSSFENSNQHTDVLTKGKETQQQTELLLKEDKALKPYVFNFNRCFVSAGFVADAGGNLAQMNNQIKMKEEESVEEFNPWNKDVKFLERVLDSHDSIQEEIIIKEGKDDREAESKEKVSIESKEKVGVNKAKVGAREKEEEKVNQQLQTESNQQQIEQLVGSNSNLKQREGDRSKK